MRRLSDGELFPGAETQPHYQLNPGEAFAENYRVLNERKAGVAQAPWQIVSQSLYPDDAALLALEQDVTVPWQGSTITTRTSSLGKAVRSRTYSATGTLDGTLRVTLRAPAKARFTVTILSAAGEQLSFGTAAKLPAALSTSICGERDFRVRVARASGAGAFRLTVSVP